MAGVAALRSPLCAAVPYHWQGWRTASSAELSAGQLHWRHWRNRGGHRASEKTACVPAGGQGWQGATQGQHPGQAAPQQQQQAAGPMETVRVGTQNSGRMLPRTGRTPMH